MRPRTMILFGSLLVTIIVCAVLFHHQHAEHLMHLDQGGMSQEVKEKFLSNGIDCKEVYEIQGYEGPESILRMFTLSQHEFSQLNPGVGMFWKQGDIVCVKGIFGVADTLVFEWFWPLVAVGCAIAGFLSNVLVNHYKTAEERKNSGIIGGGAPARASEPSPSKAAGAAAAAEPV